MASVECIDIDKAKKAVKDCPLIVRQYVRGLESALECSHHTTQKAIKKLKAQAEELKGHMEFNVKRHI